MHAETYRSQEETLYKVCQFTGLLLRLTHHFIWVPRGAKPIQLFAQREDQGEHNDEQGDAEVIPSSENKEKKLDIDEENPF